jgi:hypothetical protein
MVASLRCSRPKFIHFIYLCRVCCCTVCPMLSALWYCVNSSRYGYFDGIHPVLLWQISSYLFIAVKHNRFYLLNIKLNVTCFSLWPASGIEVHSSKPKLMFVLMNFKFLSCANVCVHEFVIIHSFKLEYLCNYSTYRGVKIITQS